MKLFTKCVAGIVFVLLLVWYFWIDLALYGVSYMYSDLSVSSQEAEQDFEKFYPQLLADAAIMKTIPVFHPMTYNADASGFLNPIVSWSGDHELIKKMNENSSANPLKLNQELVDILNTEKDYAKIKLDWSEYNLDFSWFKKILAYDHWNFSQSAPYPKNEMPFEVVSAPIPSYRELITWSKLYLLYSRDQNLLDENTKDIDHLAKLVFSNQSTMNALIALNILILKKEFQSSLSADEQKSFQGVLLTDDQIKSVKRFAFMFIGLPTIVISDDIFNKVRYIEMSSCIFLEETMLMNADLKILFSAAYPNSILRVDKFLQESVSRCPDSYAKRAWSSKVYQDRIAQLNPMNIVNVFNHEATDANTEKNNIFSREITYADLAKSPRIAKAIADIVLSISAPDPFRHYRENK
jgi:hypothetical protein